MPRRDPDHGSECQHGRQRHHHHRDRRWHPRRPDWRPDWRPRRGGPAHLYLEIYRAFIWVMVISAVLAVLAAKLLWTPADFEPPTLVVQGAEMIVASLPKDMPLPEALATRADELDVELSLWSSDGTPLANRPGHPPPNRENGFEWIGGPGRGGFSLQLEDQRYLRLSAHNRHGYHVVPFLGVMALVLVSLALVTHKVARRITRRLEGLQDGVERFGTGELKSRVRVRGRDEVARLAQAFNETATQIETLVGHQRRMLASASHELRAPLSRLRMALELLLDDESSAGAEKRATLLADASSDIEELDALVGDLLLAASLSQPQHPDRLKPVNLAEIVQTECRRVGAEARVAQATLPGDKNMLRRLIRNLLDNAAKYGGPGVPSVELTVEEPGSRARLRVCDRGPGVRESERERIFEPFYRPQGHAESRDGGVGLGLSLVRQIAQHHGGDVTYREGEGGGSCFEVTLPNATS